MIQTPITWPTDLTVMSPAHSQGSLYLCPKQTTCNVSDLPAFIVALQEIGLIAQKTNPQLNSHHYFTGDKYLNHIAYMGCAPTIQFEASDNSETFCFIKIHQYQTARLIHSMKQSRTPHCPRCNKPVKNWQDKKAASTIHCDLCDNTSNIEKFNWRKMAGYAQLFIEITDIYPKEAIPQPLLLDKLAGITDTRWQYFYSCQ